MQAKRVGKPLFLRLPHNPTRAQRLHSVGSNAGSSEDLRGPQTPAQDFTTTRPYSPLGFTSRHSSKAEYQAGFSAIHSQESSLVSSPNPSRGVSSRYAPTPALQTYHRTELLFPSDSPPIGTTEALHQSKQDQRSSSPPAPSYSQAPSSGGVTFWDSAGTTASAKHPREHTSSVRAERTVGQSDSSSVVQSERYGPVESSTDRQVMRSRTSARHPEMREMQLLKMIDSQDILHGGGMVMPAVTEVDVKAIRGDGKCDDSIRAVEGEDRIGAHSIAEGAAAVTAAKMRGLLDFDSANAELIADFAKAARDAFETGTALLTLVA